MTKATLLRSLSSALAAAIVLAVGGASSFAGSADHESLSDNTSGALFEHPPTLLTFELEDSAEERLSLLRPYFNAAVERPGPYGRYVRGRYGTWSREPWYTLEWRPSTEPVDGPASETKERATALTAKPSIQLLAASSGVQPPSFGFETRDTDLNVRLPANDWMTRFFAAFDEAPFWTTGPSLASDGLHALWVPPEKRPKDWRCRRRPVLFIRYAGENDRFSLVACNGAVEPGAVERLSILARPPKVPDPGELPEEPDPAAWEQNGEWLPRVKLVNPRLLWLLQKIADTFPYRAVYVYSGYRPHHDKSGQGHISKHSEGRAMDIQVHGIRNETLFQFCRKLEDVGCGYYPNSKFVHVDVRRPGTGHAFWIDISGPSEPSRYVDSWPGVVESGALAWMKVPEKNTASQSPRPRTPDDRGTADVIRR